MESQFSFHDNNFIPLYAVPIEEKLQIAYNVYEPSKETKTLSSEANRTLHAESFMSDNGLGPLSYLCVRAIATRYGPGELMPIVTNDSQYLRIYYDTLSVDWPLEQCYFVTDEKYWRRVVLEKSPDKSLSYKKNFDWKPLAISLRYAELLESCAAEYVPESVEELAPFMKEYITELKIQNLQSLREYSFAPHFRHSDTESTNDTDSSDFTIFSVEIPKEAIDAEFEEDDNAEDKAEGKNRNAVKKSEKELEWERKETERAFARIEEIEALKKAKRRRREIRADGRRRRRFIRERSLVVQTPLLPPKRKSMKNATKKLGNKKKVDDSGVFDIVIPPEEDDSYMDIPDRRNLETLLKNTRRYKYPPQHCHHINLSFLRLLDDLAVLHIEFQGPKGMKFENRHLNFSYLDMDNLAFALCFLVNLKVFRLRNSRMDCRKVHILVQPLQYLAVLETVDFGYDQLNDDCGAAFYILFQNPSIKCLELEGNLVSINVLSQIADALHKFSGEFEYLGLAHNPLGDKALHMLTEGIIGTQQLKHLCISGASITQEAIASCIANELLRQHPILINLDMKSLHIGSYAATEIIKALHSNLTILNFDCRGCGLHYDIDFDINVVLERNRFIVQNPFLGDESKTEEEVIEFVNRVKNPILLKAFDAIKETVDCLKVRSDECCSSIEFVDEEKEEGEPFERIASFASSNSTASNSTFDYDPNKFNLEEFARHVYNHGIQRKSRSFKSHKF